MANDPIDTVTGQVSGMTQTTEAEAKGSGVKDRNLNLIMDIPLKVTVELGRTKMPVSELLNLTQGSVIELAKLAGEPMEVLVNDKLIARGEAVVVNEKFGVRLTDIISPSERIEQLK
jgi:flagellar motor switch protein FliN/FliY